MGKIILLGIGIFGVLFFYEIFSKEKQKVKASIRLNSSYVGNIDVGGKVYKDNDVRLIDPQLCKRSPEGFTYFQLGDEIFRYRVDSPIKVHKVDLNSRSREGKKILSDSDSEGCAGNPYVGVWLTYTYEDTDDEYKKINIKRLLGVDVLREKRSLVSVGQVLHEDSYHRLKNNNKPCEYLDRDLERCVWPYDDNEMNWARVYRAVNHKSMGKPFYLDCTRLVGDLECKTYYRLYNSFNFGYIFYLSENQNWRDSDVVKFDKYLRDVFEAMRVVGDN